MSRNDAGKLTGEQRRLADEIAGRALDLPESDRAVFVRAGCDGDGAVIEEVLSLLDYVSEADRNKLLEETPVLPPMGDGQPDSDFKKPEIPGFRIERELGRGGMGVVYEAYQPSLGRAVALKVLPASHAFNPKAVERFRREARAAAKLHNPHIVPVFDFGEHEGLYYYTMELVEGRSLAAIIKEARSRRESNKSDTTTADPGYIAEVVEQTAALAGALHVAHEGGLLHRDLKPSNIIVGSDGQYHLIDFGLVRERGAQTLTMTGELLGTLTYMSPEQLAGQAVDCRTDIYSLGATLYEALTLEPPFKGSSDHALQSRIFSEEPEKPTRKNLKLSRDLETVVLKALEKSPKRRYNTASEFAEDLQRFLHYEPIQARPVGPVTKSIRWTHRNPAKAVAVCAVLILVLSGAGFFIGQGMVRAQSVRDHIARAEQLLEEGNFAGAMEAVGRAQGLDPASFAALSTRTRIEERSKNEEERRAALALEEDRMASLRSAEEARAEAAMKVEAYELEREAVDGLKTAIDEEERIASSEFIPKAKRTVLAGLERDLERKEIESKRLLEEAREALERAARLEAPWGGCSPATDAAFASFFHDRWREALNAGDVVREEVFRSSVELWDKADTYKQALLGRGTLSVDVTPAAAEIHLFRFESYETVRSDPPVIPRQVPVPTRGIGRLKEGSRVEDFYPGDLCLKIVAVKKESRPWKAGLRRGDLVIRVNGAPCGDGVFVKEVSPGSIAADKGIEPLARIDLIDSEKMETTFDWHHAGEGRKWEEEHAHQLGIGEKEVEARCSVGHLKTPAPLTDLFGIEPVDAQELLHGKATHPMTILCLHQGKSITLTVPEDEESGLSCEVTAYPLILSPENRIRGSAEIPVDPGSYLLFVRSEGFEDQRYLVLVPREEMTVAKVALIEEGSTPPGFVYIPPGPFIYGGDPLAFMSEPKQVIELDGFFMAEKEITNGEWFQFLNAEETLKIIEENQGDDLKRNLLLPRQSNGLLTRKTREGLYEPTYGTQDTPVLGLSSNDIWYYILWRNKTERLAGKPWKYDLPDGKEWEKAARGVDGRFFPWGDRFDSSLTVVKYRKRIVLFQAPGRFEPRDRSPFGVADMGGSRMEWTREETAPKSRMFIMKGASWTYMKDLFSRCANRSTKILTMYSTDTGFRLIARLR